MLEQFLRYVRNSEGGLARVNDPTASTIQSWMDDMANSDLALSTMRARCGVGSWGFPRRQRPSMADYVAVTGAHGRGARRRRGLMLASLG